MPISIIFQKFSSGCLIDAGCRRIFYMNRSMREAGPNYGNIGWGEAANISVCKVFLGKKPNKKQINVEECVAHAWTEKYTLGNRTWINSNGLKVLIEITVKSKIKFGDRVSVELDLDFVRDVLETGDADQFRGKWKALFGIVNMNKDSLKMSPLPSQHHLKSFKNHVTDMNCRIIGLVMDVEGTHDTQKKTTFSLG